MYKRQDAKRAIVLQRYCHVFRAGELVELVREAAAACGCGAALEEEYYDRGNWAVAVRKTRAAPTEPERIRAA